MLKKSYSGFCINKTVELKLSKTSQGKEQKNPKVQCERPFHCQGLMITRYSQTMYIVHNIGSEF